MKVTANWVLRHFSFLAPLLDQGHVSGRKKLRLQVKFGPVAITQPADDRAVRYTSMGHLTGTSFTHFAGSDASVANSPAELVASESPIEGKSVNSGCYYAILDRLDFYGMRDLTIYLNGTDVTHFQLELKNQLRPILPAT